MKLRPITIMGALAVVAVAAAATNSCRGGGVDARPAALPVVIGRPAAAAASPAMGGGGPGPTTFVAGTGLARLDGSAPAWRVAGPRPTDAGVARLASAVGLSGSPAFADGMWSVSGSTTTLTVSNKGSSGGWTWSYAPEAVPVAATAASPPTPAAGDASTICETFRGPPEAVLGGCGSPAPSPPAGVPDRTAAEGAARSLWAKAGFDTSGWRITSSADEWSAQVTATPVLDSRSVEGADFSVSFGGGAEVTAAAGWLGDPAPADTYSLIGTTKAIAALNAGDTIGAVEPMIGSASAPVTTTFSSGAGSAPATPACRPAPGCASCDPLVSCSPPVATCNNPLASCGAPAAAPTTTCPSGASCPSCRPRGPCPVCPPDERCAYPGAPPDPTVTMAPVTVSIDRAELVLVAEPGTDGATWLVPAYRLSSSTTDGSWTVLAIDRSYIAPTPPVPPVPPTDPSGGPSGTAVPGSTPGAPGPTSTAPPTATTQAPSPEGPGPGPGPSPASTTTPGSTPTSTGPPR